MIRMLTETRWVEIAPVSGWARWSHALLLLGVLVMVAVGLYLTPDPAGHGTHQQLGLPPCLGLLSRPLHQTLIVPLRNLAVG